MHSMRTIIHTRSGIMLALLFIFMFSACDKSENETFIRLSNTSSYNFEDVTIVTYGISKDYGDLEAGSSSSYKTFEHASSSVSVNVKIDETDFYYFSPSYVGDQVFTPGNYTFNIGVEDYANGVLSFDIDKD